MFRNKRREAKKDSLQAQLELLAALRSRHFLWANDSGDPEITRLHLEVLGLIRQLRDKLFDIYIYIYIMSKFCHFITYSIISKYNFAAQWLRITETRGRVGTGRRA